MGTDLRDSPLSFCLGRRSNLGPLSRNGSSALRGLRLHVPFSLVHMPRHSSREFRILAWSSRGGGRSKFVFDWQRKGISFCSLQLSNFCRTGSADRARVPDSLWKRRAALPSRGRALLLTDFESSSK